MLPYLQDTIVAVSSATGVGARAIIRMSGPQSLKIAESCFQSSEPIAKDRRCLVQGEFVWLEVSAPLPGDLYVFPEPATYTGQDMAEMHVLSSPPLVESLVAFCLNSGARAAQPGEFTMRAFLSGKLDLTRAEAVLAVIDAGNRSELHDALTQMAGGVTQPMQTLRDDLLDLLADVEAGLDFTDEDITFVETEDMLHRLTKGMALVTLTRKQLDKRSIGERPFRVVLWGEPNAGKSSLFNAMGGGAPALVSPQPGTTRDYLIQKLEVQGIPFEIIDTAGQRHRGNGIEGAAQKLGQEQAEHADLVLWCVDVMQEKDGAEPDGCQEIVKIATKCDMAAAPPDRLGTSSVTRQGLEELRRLLAEKAREHFRPALAPSLSRCRHHIDTCLANLRRAHRCTLEEDPPEIIAMELRDALEQLGAMVGAVYTDDLLDRIFSRFCIGK